MPETSSPPSPCPRRRRTVLQHGLALVLSAMAAPLAAPAVLRAQEAPRLRDLLGREIALKQPARRIALGQGRHLAVLNLLHPDPASLVVGWADDMRRGEGAEYQAYLRRFPALDRLPVLGFSTGVGVLEQLLTVKPDLLLLSRRNVASLGGGTAAVSFFAPLEAAGVAVAVVDFFVRPLRDTEPSLEILGQLLGREEQAGAFLEFYRARMRAVQARLAGIGENRPRVMMQAHAGGLACCFSPGRGVYDDFIRFAGGHNIGADSIATETGQLSLEYVLTQDPHVYIATGGPYGGRGGVSLGAGVDPALARSSLAQVIESQHLSGLSAVKQGRAHALWHAFNDSPTHLMAIEAMARWFHPEATAGIDPAATLATLNQRFAAVPMQGTYWTNLKA